ncbi:protease-like protein [Azospirillum brasilense]|uniref:M10 family metallopeptidase C-terminal domain-containing protein n=1 Tax=Azospirillum brasilense TaxID=192 RepID=UPI00190A210B|nr:M10 family metallopeptidase C-terminal domain-containing protein [Azospirillum brasilense]MBK3734895.1 protease-like protein [Azospirillum brasilense]
MPAASWVPTSAATVYGLTAANRPATDIDGGPLGCDPALLRTGIVTAPQAISDPSLTPILSGAKWGTTQAAVPVTLTYSFYENGGPAVATAGVNPAPLNAGFRDAIRGALASIADVAGIRFVEITETTTGGPLTAPGASGALVGHLRFIDDARLDSDPGTPAYAIGPSASTLSSGLVAFDSDRVDAASAAGHARILREIGHALGLTDSFEPGDAPAAGNDPRAENGVWSTGWTMMSVTPPASRLPAGTAFNPVGPMAADIQVLQSWYGANLSTRTGDDVYRIDGPLAGAAIWDAGGTDTLDASAAASGLHIDLSSNEINGNAVIAKGISIENAIGGAGNDTIFGSFSSPIHLVNGTLLPGSANNRLDGGPGNDDIMAGSGDDTLIGGTGSNVLDGSLGYDTAVYGAASTDAYAYSLHGTLFLSIPKLGISDRLHGIEQLSFTDRSVAVADATSILRSPLPNPVKEPPVPVPIDPARRLSITRGGVSSEIAMDRYSGPVNWLHNSHIGQNDSEAMRGTERADFINTVGGDDAVDGSGGDDVLDGGLGSNFLTGGNGSDTFFVDGRGGGVTWSTVTDLEAGEWVTAWGWKEGTSKLTWAEMAGAESAKGVTAHIDLDSNGSIDMSMTIAGKSLGAIFVTPGEVGGSSYLAFALK